MSLEAHPATVALTQGTHFWKRASGNRLTILCSAGKATDSMESLETEI
jgi:hypothetical protein